MEIGAGGVGADGNVGGFRPVAGVNQWGFGSAGRDAIAISYILDPERKIIETLILCNHL